LSRVVLIIAGAAAAGVVSLLVTESKFAAANPGAVSQQTYAYGLVDPNANGRGTPGLSSRKTWQAFAASESVVTAYVGRCISTLAQSSSPRPTGSSQTADTD